MVALRRLTKYINDIAALLLAYKSWTKDPVYEELIGKLAEWRIAFVSPTASGIFMFENGVMLTNEQAHAKMRELILHGDPTPILGREPSSPN